MMVDILGNNKLFVGSSDDLRNLNDNKWAIVHCAQTYHYAIMGWDWKMNKPDRNHPNYILYEDENTISLNWVDSKSARLYDWTGVDRFKQILDFIDKKLISGKKVLVHCDQGQSRSPTIGLLYLAKRTKVIPSGSFVDAKKAFIERIYPNYLPKGIGNYVAEHWDEII